jgi:hypothetical protein
VNVKYDYRLLTSLIPLSVTTFRGRQIAFALSFHFILALPFPSLGFLFGADLDIHAVRDCRDSTHVYFSSRINWRPLELFRSLDESDTHMFYDLFHSSI